VERAFDLKSALGSPASYRKILTRLWGLHTAWERYAHGLIDEVILKPRCKVAWLDEDLYSLGMSTADILCIGTCPLASLASNCSAAWGAMYVLEGSTLGGKIIYGQVNARLAIDRFTGARFFYGYGALTREFWSRFGEILQTQSAERRLVLSESIGGAQAMFASTAQWLSTGCMAQ